MKEKTTYHRNGDGTTRVTRQTFNDGSKKTTTSSGTRGLFGHFSGSIRSVTKTDSKGNSWTKKR